MIRFNLVKKRFETYKLNLVLSSEYILFFIPAFRCPLAAVFRDAGCRDVPPGASVAWTAPDAKSKIQPPGYACLFLPPRFWAFFLYRNRHSRHKIRPFRKVGRT